MAYPRIEDHGIIGDLSTVALVCTNGTINFLCLPDFDSPTCFASLLDERAGGYFSLCPRGDDYTSRQMYLPDTNILVTRFLSENSLVEVLDFMTISAEDAPQLVVRIAHVIRGEVGFDFECLPALNYARDNEEAKSGENFAEFVARDDDGLRFRLSWNLGNGAQVSTSSTDGVKGRFELKKDAWAYLVFERSKEGERPLDLSHDAMQQLFRATRAYWQNWMSQSSYRGRWRETVNRSALALKLLTSRKY